MKYEQLTDEQRMKFHAIRGAMPEQKEAFSPLWFLIGILIFVLGSFVTIEMTEELMR